MLRVFKNPCVVLPLACTALMFVGYASMNTYITPFMEGVLPDPTWVSGALFAFGLMSMVGSKASGWAADRFGSAPAVIGCVALQYSRAGAPSLAPSYASFTPLRAATCA